MKRPLKKEPFKLTWRHRLEIYMDYQGPFARRSDITKSVQRKIREIKIREGYEVEDEESPRSERERIVAELEAGGISIPPDVANRVFGDKY